MDTPLVSHRSISLSSNLTATQNKKEKMSEYGFWVHGMDKTSCMQTPASMYVSLTLFAATISLLMFV